MISRIRGFVDIAEISSETGEVLWEETEEILIENLTLNLLRRQLLLNLNPRIITGRTDNSSSLQSWQDRRICLIGFGIGDGLITPSVKPEEPEDGRTILIGEASYPNSKFGLQAPIRRIPLTSGPSEVNLPIGAGDPTNEDINGYYLLKEIDSDGVEFVEVSGGGAEVRYGFTIEENEYVGSIMEYCLYLGGGAGSDPDTAVTEISPGVFEKDRLSREQATAVARKTRSSALESKNNSKFRILWRFRS